MARRAEPARPEAYVDTSAFIAFLDRSDSHHPTFRRLFGSPPALVTSGLVIAEGHGWFLRRYDRYRAMQFLAFVEALPDLKVLSFGAQDLVKVRRILSRFGDQELTLADTHGLAIMEERRYKICWSTDWHLGLMGAELIIQR